MSAEDLILLDTCVLMSNPDIVLRVHQKGGTVFITNTVLDELDYNKKGTESHNQSAKRVLKELQINGVKQVIDDENIDTLKQDILSSSTYKGVPVNIIHRSSFNSTGNNDDKIIEIAKDYSLKLISADRGIVLRAQTSGVKSHYWHGEEIQRYTPSRDQKTNFSNPRALGVSSNIKPFAVHTKPISKSPEVLTIDRLPKEGDSVKTSTGKLLALRSMLSEGGEGRIFLTDDPALVCKIYRPEKLTDLKRDKIKLMLTRPLRIQGIAWPIDFVANAAGQFCGYIMPKARGVPLQPTIFVKPHFEKTLPTWKRRDLARVCLRFLELVKTLHDANILVGDINPQNVLINPDSTDVWLVDTDSFQIENYPCPVGTAHFTAPEIQGQEYGRFLRTKDHELFAVATMLFAILMCGKYPYSLQGGGTPAENIRNKVFPYPFHSIKAGIEHHGLTVPPGTYRFMWSHLTHKLKEAFHEAFREGMRVPIDRWMELIDSYGFSIARGYVSDDLFPKQEKITDGTETSCGSCGTSFTIQKDFLTKLQADGKSPSCPSCRRKFQLQNLANRAATASNPNQSRRSSSAWQIQNPVSARSASPTRWKLPTTRQAPFRPRAGSTPTRTPKPGSQQPSNNASPWWGIAILVGLLGLGYAFLGVAGVVIVILGVLWLIGKTLKT